MGVGYVTVAPLAFVAGTVRSATGENRGPLVSATVTLNVALEWLPSGSDAVHVTVVVPIGNVVLGGGEHVSVVPA